MIESPRWLDEQQQEHWQAVVLLTRRIYSALSRDLQESSDLSGADFEVLVALTRYSEAKARSKDLVNELEWDRSRLSHQLKRMERRGYIHRQECLEDKRGFFVQVTDSGHQVLARAVPSHVETVRELIVDQLSSAQFASLGEIAKHLLVEKPINPVVERSSD